MFKKVTINDGVLYPHLKITREKFPRLLATRRILNETDEYFGAFLPKTNVRIWLSRLNKIFRLRNCEIEIDGSFPLPCQMYFAKKCLAPCVSEICGQTEYSENVEALRLFLSGAEKDLEKFVIAKIDEFSDALEFEKAARWRDVWRESQSLTQHKKYQIDLRNAVDTYSYAETENQIFIYLVTTRGRKLVGRKEFVFEKNPDFTVAELFEKTIADFYKFHLPREIRLPEMFPARKNIENFLYRKFNQKIKISAHHDNLNLTAQFRLKRAKLESNLEKLGGKISVETIKNNLRKLFNLSKKPNLIECFDVAHISNQNFVTASSVWENGKLRPEKSRYWIVDVENELQAMALGVKLRLENSPPPDLIIIDGGKGQLKAVLSETENIAISVISAVKPARRHREISHLLTADNRKINFIEGEKTFETIRRLRDEAHFTANEFHRQLRQNRSLFQVELPLVKIRFDEIDGAADDILPINLFSKS